MSSIINWFEIPVTDIDRAITFYSAILGKSIEKTQYGAMPYAFLPMEGDGVGGALAQGEGCVPSTQGVTIYLSGGNDLSGALSKVEAAGGSIQVPKTALGDGMGYFALFLDNQGNKIGLHSPH